MKSTGSAITIPKAMETRTALHKSTGEGAQGGREQKIAPYRPDSNILQQTARGSAGRPQ